MRGGVSCNFDMARGGRGEGGGGEANAVRTISFLQDTIRWPVVHMNDTGTAAL